MLKTCASGIISADILHDPAGLLPITLFSGEGLIASKQFISFTRHEEIDFGTVGDTPYPLKKS